MKNWYAPMLPQQEDPMARQNLMASLGQGVPGLDPSMQKPQFTPLPPLDNPPPGLNQPPQAAPPPAKSVWTNLPMKPEASDQQSPEQEQEQLYLQQLQASQAAQDKAQADYNKEREPTLMEKIDFKPISALLDQYNGTNLSGSMKNNTAQADFENKKMMLQAALDKSRGSNLQDRLNYLKMKSEEKNKAELAQARLEAARATAGVRGQSLDLRAQIAAGRAGRDFESDPIIRDSKKSLNSLDRSMSILDNPNKPVTTKDLNLAYQDYINAVAVGGTATEGKISRELPATFEQYWNDVKGKAGQFDDLRKSPTGQQLIKMLTENIHTVHRDLGGALSNQAESVYGNYSGVTNPYIRGVVDSKHKQYQKYGAQKSTVKVRDHDGQVMEIPAEYLDDAIADGAERID